MSRKPRILIADDDNALLEAMRIRLAQAGVELMTATDGYTSLSRILDFRPDLVVLDVNMPAGDGFSVQERLSHIGKMPSIPVIYMTGDRSERLEEVAEKYGAVAVLRKPFEMRDLIAHIKQTLRPRAA